MFLYYVFITYHFLNRLKFNIEGTWYLKKSIMD